MYYNNYICQKLGKIENLKIKKNKSRELKKNILSLNSELNQKKKNFDSDSPFQSEDYINRLWRRKKRIEKKLNGVPLIQIKILTR